jgi:CPA2 family monovalent cation:H+ antiporter-2
MKRRSCEHLAQVEVVAPAGTVCQSCVDAGDAWVHLRACLSCGHVGCCDQSKNRHARRHHQETGHPLIRSIEPGESWIYCYEDDAYPRPA